MHERHPRVPLTRRIPLTRHNPMTHRSILVGICIAVLTAANSAAQTPPPAPMLVAPSSGASVVQPVTLQWTAVSDPDGPIGSYSWQLGTTSAFSVVIADGFTDVRNGDPIPTFARLSGLPNGTYFWRVKATQDVGGATGFIDSPWSAVRTLTITGLGPAPGTPSFTAPANLSQFHALENFDITWTAVPNALYYLLEADDEPSFSAPQTLTLDAMQFGTTFHAGWGNEIPNVYYRVRAVSADNVRGLPSATLNVKIVNTAPVAPAPTVQSPVGGATVSVPFMFNWTDTPNPQVSAYDLDVDTDPNFAGSFGVLLVQGVNRSDYVVAHDVPLPPGTYFWRVRALHGAVAGPWSASGSFRVVASPPTPPGLDLLWILPEPGTVEGGATTQARVTLSGPAPTGGATVRIISDMAGVEVPATVTVPAGATDATVSPITTIPVGVGIVGALRADYGTGMQISSFGMVPLLFSLALNTDNVAGGNPVTGIITLQRPAPANIDVTIVSSDTSLAQPPGHVIVPAGDTSASFSISTATVAAPVPVVFNVGTANDGYHAPQARLTIRPAGSAAPAPSLSTVTLTSPGVVGGTSATGTVTLTGPAPAGGASVQVTGSSSGTQHVNVPAGGQSASFTITTSDANFSRWGMVQASYGSSDSGLHGAVLRVDPDVPAIPSLLAFGINPTSTTAGGSVRGVVGLVTPAPPGGTTISLSSDNPAAQVPASVNIAAGNSATTFTVGTSAVGSFTSATITGSTGADTREVFLDIFPDPNAGPQLASVTPGVSSATGGTSVTATVTLTGAAPAGGASITMATSSTKAQAPPIVTVPAGQTSATFTITTSTVTQNTLITVTGTFGNGSKSGSFTLVPGTAGDTTPPTASITSPAAGATVSGTVGIQANASDNVGVTRVDFLVDGSLLSSDTTAPYSASWNTTGVANGTHSLTARAFDAANNQKTSAAVSVSVDNGTTTTAPALTLSGVPATIRRGQTFTATATVTNNAAAAASGFSVRVSFTPSSALRLQSPTATTQSVPTVAPGTSRNVTWQMRADNAGTATLTMTLRDASGATVRTVSQPITITN
jgi:predicted secreted protein